jgi:hypothetical protein
MSGVRYNPAIVRRLFRILFNSATAVSLVLCFATAGLWVRGYLVTDSWFVQTWTVEGDRSRWTQDTLRCGRGGFGMARIVQYFDSKEAAALMARYESLPTHSATSAKYPDFNFGDTPVWGGFKHGAFAHDDAGAPAVQRPPKVYGWQWVVPLWAVVPPLAILPAVSAWRLFRRWRRVGVGCCPICGYDLRATPDRCPECGTIARS